jgi:hypothetical protein
MSAVNSSHMKYWGLHFLTLPISTYVTEGVAKICGFEVLRHGTSFPNYVNILKKGVDFSHAGKVSEEAAFDDSTKKQALACKNRFYIFKDSEACIDDGDLKSKTLGQIFKRTHTRLHAVLAGAYYAKGTKNRVLCLIKKIVYGILNFFCPTVRFMYRKDEMQKFDSEKKFEAHKDEKHLNPRFISDEDYYGAAYKTPDSLPNDRIGLIGLCRNARWEDVKRIFKTNPSQILLGSIQIIIGLALTAIGAGILL